MQGIKIFAGGAGDVRKGNGTAEDKSQNPLKAILIY
jgi:hypothetical protein